MKYLKKHLSAANVLSCVALFVALSSVAYAATNLARNSVKPRHITRGAVTTPKLRNGAVTTPKLRNGAVVASKIAPGQIGTNQLSDGDVRSADLGGGVVTEGKIKNGAVTGEKIANGAVTNSKLGPDAVTTGKVQDGTVTGAKLAPSFLAQLVRGVSYETKASDSDSSDVPKSVTAECPGGKAAIGGGAKVSGSAITVAVTESVPTPPGPSGKRTGWTATAAEISPSVGDWVVEAYAVCAEL